MVAKLSITLSAIFILSAFSSFNTLANEKAPINSCGNSTEAIELVRLIQQDTEQQRGSIRCNLTLAKAAEAKAKLMADYGIVRHNLGGSPNSHLEETGYKLPHYYGKDFNSNQVEAIAGGYTDAKRVWHAFKQSKEHRTHLLGEHEFYVEQDEIGVAFINDYSTPHDEYWVVYLTKGFQPDQVYQGDIEAAPNKSDMILHIENDKPVFKPEPSATNQK